MTYKDCYYYSERNGCIKELIDYGWTYHCNKRNDCPQFNGKPKDEMIKKIDEK